MSIPAGFQVKHVCMICEHSDDDSLELEDLMKPWCNKHEQYVYAYTCCDDFKLGETEDGEE